MLYNHSKRVLKDKFGETSLSVSAWQEKQIALRRQSEELSTQYKPICEKLDKVLNMQYCIEVARNDNRKKKQEKKKDQPILGRHQPKDIRFQNNLGMYKNSCVCIIG